MNKVPPAVGEVPFDVAELETGVVPASPSAPTAEFFLPTGNEPGFLQFPDGQRFDVVPAGWAEPAHAPAAGAPGAAPAGGAAGQGNGTNPAENITTFIVSNEYYELDGGNEISTTYARFKFPICNQRGSVLFETPYTFYDVTASSPMAPQIGGLADIKFQISYNSLVSDDHKVTVINFLEAYIPSADNAAVGVKPGGNTLTAFNLGTGKYVLGPGIGMVFAIEPNFIIAPLYFFEASVAGDNSKPEIRRGKWRLFAMYAFEGGEYLLPELQILTDYFSGNNDIYFAPEFGRSKDGFTFYAKPGFGIAPDTNDRQWGMEFGLRINF